jgi:hypothetical protein
MNTDTNRPDDPDPDDLDGLAASLDHLNLWCEQEGPATVQPQPSAGNTAPEATPILGPPLPDGCHLAA